MPGAARSATLLQLLAGQLLPGRTAAHGAVTRPPPRNALDADLPPWNGPVPSPLPFGERGVWTPAKVDFWCASPSAAAAGGPSALNLTGQSGQACYWFSNGCQIGCGACDGSTRGPVPKFILPGGKTPPNWDPWAAPGLVPDPAYPQPNIFGNSTPISAGGSGQSICAARRPRATICDRRLRTVNIDAPCGGLTDYYYYSPWRAPGTAPVLDACGVAGGRRPGQGDGGAGAAYANTSNARLADLGSKLPARPSGTVWAAGAVVEVAFTTSAFHGGGYAYRICPAHARGGLTEACFQRTPLRFATRESCLRWGGVSGERLCFNATFVNEGTAPAGSMWARHPVPRGPWGWGRTGPSHPPVCVESAACRATNGLRRPGHATANATHGGCRCSDDGAPSGPANVEVVDTLRLPAGLPAGPYVLGWRWDSEESNQVWASCSDVTVKAA
jgi:hypothetical protein